MRPKLYIAGPLFSDAERAFNSRLGAVLAQHFEVFLPQESGYLLREMLEEGEPLQTSMRAVFERDLSAIRSTDYFLIILDGRAVDEGAAFELGVAFSEGKKCFALQTDWRQLLPIGHNPMLVGALTQVFYNVKDLYGWARSLTRCPQIADRTSMA